MALTPVDISSYSAFKSAVLGNGYDVDGIAGFQCVDMAKLLAGNAGRSTPYWRSGVDGYAYEGWTDATSRAYNKGDLFTLVYNKKDVRQGDLVVLDHGRFSGDTTGHIAFADSDWNANTTSAVLLGQNQVNPNPTTGHVNTLTNMSVTKFLGAFRFIAWQEPEPTPKKKKKRYPWAVLGNEVRNRMIG